MKQLKFDLERDDLCERMGGALPGGSLVVIEAEYGGGKSILGQRLAYGLVENGASVAYVSTELTTQGFLAQMESLEYDVEAPMLDERLVFIPAYPLLGHPVPSQDLLQRIVQAKRMYTRDVVVFDTFSKFLANHIRTVGGGTRSMDQIEAVLYHFKRLTSLGKTIILTFEKNQVQESVAALFKESADAFISIQFELIGNTAARRIVVHRLSRAAGRFGDVIGFRVEPGVGIVIEIKSVV